MLVIPCSYNSESMPIDAPIICTLYLTSQSVGGATQVWFAWGRVTETWKVDPFLYQILSKTETHFYTRVTNFKQNLLKISHYFP